jgi:hypothetical protein
MSGEAGKRFSEKERAPTKDSNAPAPGAKWIAAAN